MKINRLKIKSLFDLFDYDLDFTNEENLKIITGPNGFGKTMILNILYSLFQRQFSFFHKLVFEQIEVFFENDFKLEITKKEAEAPEETKSNQSQFNKNSQFIPPDFKVTEDINTKTTSKNNKTFEIDICFIKKEKEFFKTPVTLPLNKEGFEQFSSFFLEKEERASTLLNSVKSYLIGINRLEIEDGENYFLLESIKKCPEELKLLIDEKRDEYGKTSEKLSADFSKRVLNFKEIISKDIVKSKVERLKEKQKVLKKYDLSEIELDMPNLNEISENDLKLVSVDLDDLEKKLSVFDDLLEKIKLFVDILSERRLSFKHIEIDLEKGFICRNDKGKILSLEELSSGEKHQIVLLYELIFKTTENTLLLIDEPEISLHVAWQHDFIEDLKRIVELKNIQVIVATHAPAIINDHWDLVTDLFDESEKNQAK